MHEAKLEEEAGLDTFVEGLRDKPIMSMYKIIFCLLFDSKFFDFDLFCSLFFFCWAASHLYM
jgi:hypothetical protein